MVFARIPSPSRMIGPLAGMMLAAAVSSATAASKPTPACPFGVEKAVETALANEGEIEEARSLPRLERDPDRVAEVPSEIYEYLGYPQTPDETRPNALLFYVNDEDSVCAFFVQANLAGPDPVTFRSFRLALGPTALSAAIEGELEGFVRSGDAPKRGPVLRPDAGKAPTEEMPSRGAQPLLPDKPATGRPARDHLAAISALILPPEVAAEMPGLASLSVVPALNIGIVPIGALDPTGSGEPILATTSVKVEAALSHVIDNRIFGWSGLTAEDQIAIFGDPDATTDAEWSFPRLPGAAREATEVARILGRPVETGSAVTAEAISASFAGSAYIHIAAHGISDPGDPIDGSFLALTGGRLTARQIQSGKLGQTPLVVLSACQTALGRSLPGGIIGLSRAFIIGGASQAIASLWNVDDEATAWIMIRFADLLRQTSPADAIRRAQDEARGKWDDPRIWSAFMVFGSRMVGI